MEKGVKLALPLSLVFNTFPVGVLTDRFLTPDDPHGPQISQRGDDPMRFMSYHPKAKNCSARLCVRTSLQFEINAEN